MTEDEGRAAVIAAARSWRGTPFHNHGNLKGIGVDCAMLIRAAFVESGVVPSFDIPWYSPQHFMHSDEERYMAVVLTFAREIPRQEAKPADVVLYKLGRSYGHGAIIMPPGFPAILHARSEAGAVIEGNSDRDSVLSAPRRAPRFFTHW
jgi:cell wall-associated NlpC family hydrolase